MFFRSRRRRDGWVALFRQSQANPTTPATLLDPTEFAIAIEKERSRSDRRELCFCIVRFDFEDSSYLSSRHPNQRKLLNRFRQRLRITDEIGEFQDTLGVLLPETFPSQAALVANYLTAIADQLGIKVSTDIFAYPEIDPDENSSHHPNSFDRVDSSHDLMSNRERGVSNGSTKARSGDHSDTVESSLADSTKGSPNGSNGRKPYPPNGNGAIATMPRVESAAENPKTNATMKSTKKPSVHRLETSIPTPRWKRAIDLVGSSLGLVVLSPVFLLAIVAVRLSSRGPAVFVQWREGKDGKLFLIYKFRTMRIGADDEKQEIRKLSEQDGPAFKIKNDPRITWVGKYLRKSCIDELPQLINVLKGEMSLVGPRPLPVDESLNCDHWHRRRLDVLPGMTCIWQVDGGRDIPFDEWMRMDLEYVEKRGMLTDIKLIVKTAIVTLLHRGSV